MTALARLLRDRRAAAAAEMALVVPPLVVIGFGAVEAGNYFLDEHRLVKAVRDGARYASRQNFANYSGCTGSPTDVSTTLRDGVKTVVRTGQVSGGTYQLSNWTDSRAVFTVKMFCVATAGGQDMRNGVYKGMTGAPVVIVRASLPYVPILGSRVGFYGRALTLYSSEQAAVVGV